MFSDKSIVMRVAYVGDYTHIISGGPRTTSNIAMK